MAYQPEEEADEVVVFQQRDDHQPRVDYGDIDKGHLIKDEPTQLIEVVDKAVELARMYMHAPDLLTKMINDIETYLEIKTMSQLAADPDIPWEIWEPLEMLIRHTESYYNRLLGSEEAREPIHRLLEQFCRKVKDIRSGCLIAELILKDELQLAQLVQNLNYIAGQVKHILVEDGNMQKQVAAIVDAKRPNLAKETRKILPELFSRLHDLARIQVSVLQQKMLDFLEGLSEVDSVELTILPTLAIYGLAAADDGAEERKKKFIQQFQHNKEMSKAVEEVFSGTEGIQKSMKSMKLTGGVETEMEGSEAAMAKAKGFEDVRPKLSEETEMDAEKAKARLEMTRTEQLEKSAADSDVRPKSRLESCTLFIGDLPDGTEVKELLNQFKQFGTILYINVGQDPGKYRGYVRFASKLCAEEAIRVLQGRDVHISDRDEPAHETRTTDTIEFRDLPPNADQGYLRTVCEKYGTIEYPRIASRVSRGYVKFQDADAASNALSELQASGEFVFMAKPRRESY